MKRLCLYILIFLIGVTLGCAKGYEATKNSESYQVSFTLDKNPPIAGENHMTIILKDAAGKAVTDAAISVEYSMPAMPAMNYTTEAVVTGNAYHATLKLSTSGAWNIAVKITRHDKTEMVNINVDAR